MTEHITGVDHAVILVGDLDGARSSFQALGFTLSPRGYHSEHMGTANHTVMLEHDYFEVLSPVEPTAHNARWRAMLESGDRLGMIALRTGDAASTARALRDAGVNVDDPVYFERPVRVSDAADSTAAFEVAQLPASETPGVAMFACQHHTPELVWLPELVQHANGARRILEISVAVAEPAALSGRYERLFGAGSAKPIEGALAVATGSAVLRLATPAALAAAYPGIDLGAIAVPAPVGLVLETGDLAAARRCLDASGIGAVQLDDGAWIAARPVHGVVLEFRGG